MENNGLNEKINALRKEKNAVILAHYYQVAEIPVSYTHLIGKNGIMGSEFS